MFLLQAAATFLLISTVTCNLIPKTWVPRLYEVYLVGSCYNGELVILLLLSAKV